MTGLVVDLFAGAGGTSTGVAAALGRPVDIAINHSPVALAVHKANHPKTRHLVSDVFEVCPREATRGRKVLLLTASPDCTHFSRSKGGKPKDRKLRSLAWVVRDWARDVRPSVIIVENVAEFLSWGPLYEIGHVMPDGRVLQEGDKLINRPIPERAGETWEQWRGNLELLGYRVEWRVLAACDYGAPTTRRRLFVIARCDDKPIVWPEPTHGPGRIPYRSAAECIDWSIPVPSIFTRKKPLAEATQRRIAAGLRRFVLEHPDPFVVPVGPHAAAGAPILIQTGQGERKGQRPRYLDIHRPLNTVVAGGQKHALVVAWLAQHYTGMVGKHLAEQPLPTITGTDHNALCTATLGGHPDRSEQVRAFLTAYYSAPHEVGQDLREPLRTIVGADRFGLVTVHGRQHIITDISMRMLNPEELLRAQFGVFSEGYDLSPARTVKAMVMGVGNSVAPEKMRALVAANACDAMRRAA